MKVFVIIIGLFTANECVFGQSMPVKPQISFNANYINSFANSIEITNSIKVFKFVFDNLDSEIFVYPTENYYYFTFNANGTKINGNIGFFPEMRSKGKINFAYYEETRFAKPDSAKEGHEFDLSADDGIILKELDPFSYSLTFEEKVVVVHLNKITKPFDSRLLLRVDEEYVGTSFDESGLSFYLIFNTNTKHLFWILNEDIPVNEKYYEYTQGILIGLRTEFAFFFDSLLNRKILFGVQKQNIIQNTWFDGPFDQLPDNFIYSGKLDLRKYIEEAFPYTKNKINKYGISLDNLSIRVALCSYLIYTTKEQLKGLLLYCKSQFTLRDEFITELTMERELQTRTQSSLK